MALATAEHEQIDLGSYLSQVREKRGIDIDLIASETKISLQNLRAMEDGDYQILPARVFTRAYYRLYAQMLSLDPEEILSWYEQDSKNYPQAEPARSQGDRLDAENAFMAERSALFSVSKFFGLSLLALLLFGGFLCWYFSWNPASFLSQQLRGLERPEEIMQTIDYDGQASFDTNLPWRKTALATSQPGDYS